MKLYPMTLSSGVDILVDDLLIGDFHELMRWKIGSKGYPYSEREQWLKLWLKEKFPNLSEYDREYAFLAAFSSGKGAEVHKYTSTCPKCKAQTELNTMVDFRKALKNDRVLKIEMKDGDTLNFTIIFKNPERANEPCVPETVIDHRYIDYTMDELTSAGLKLNIDDLIEQGGQELIYTGSEIITPETIICKRYREEPVPWAELHEDEQKEIMTFLREYHKDTIVDHSKATINGQFHFKCACGYTVSSRINRALEILDTIITTDESGLVSDVVSAMTWTSDSNVSFEDYKKMNYFEWAMVRLALKKQNDAKQPKQS